MHQFISGRVQVKVGDITKEQADAIVNAANSSLLGGGGVDGAIHAAGGRQILAECRAIRAERFPNGLPTGEVVITTAGLMPSNYVIHTVGPIYGRNGGRDAELLASCYTNSLGLALAERLSTIAFPAISTGIYGYPKDEAAVIASRAITEFLSRENGINQVRLVFRGRADSDAFLAAQEFPI